MNDAAAPSQVCPGIRIHAIDIVQPPGIGMPFIADMEAHQTMVTTALAAKTRAERPKNARSEDHSDTMRRELSRPPLEAMALAIFSASRTCHGDATRCPSRCGLWELGRATGTCPTGR